MEKVWVCKRKKVKRTRKQRLAKRYAKHLRPEDAPVTLLMGIAKMLGQELQIAQLYEFHAVPRAEREAQETEVTEEKREELPLFDQAYTETEKADSLE